MSPNARTLQMDPRAELILLVLANVIALTFEAPWVELTVCPGECVLLCGASDCGKTTVTADQRPHSPL